MSRILIEKIFHRGYLADIYFLNTPNGPILKKYFSHKTKSVLSDINIVDVFRKEVESIGLLDSIHVDGIVTPQVLEIDWRNLWYAQKYFNLTPLNKYLVRDSNFFRSDPRIFDLFYRLGEYFAKFHKQNGRLHGDLNRKNILFGHNFIFICDPSPLERQVHEKRTFDLFRVINNLYSYNIVVRFLICNKNKIAFSFLRGYDDHADVKVSSLEFKEDIIKYLQEMNVLMSKNVISYMKFLVIAFWNKVLLYRIRKNKIIWLHG